MNKKFVLISVIASFVLVTCFISPVKADDTTGGNNCNNGVCTPINPTNGASINTNTNGNVNNNVNPISIAIANGSATKDDGGAAASATSSGSSTGSVTFPIKDGHPTLEVSGSAAGSSGAAAVTVGGKMDENHNDHCDNNCNNNHDDDNNHDDNDHDKNNNNHDNKNDDKNHKNSNEDVRWNNDSHKKSSSGEDVKLSVISNASAKGSSGNRALDGSNDAVVSCNDEKNESQTLPQAGATYGLPALLAILSGAAGIYFKQKKVGGFILNPKF